MDPNFLSFGQKYIVMEITWFKFQDLQGKWSFQRHHKIWFKHLKTIIYNFYLYTLLVCLGCCLFVCVHKTSKWAHILCGTSHDPREDMDDQN